MIFYPNLEKDTFTLQINLDHKDTQCLNNQKEKNAIFWPIFNIAGTLIGRVKQSSAACTFNFEVQDAAGNKQLMIEGPCLMCRCCSDVEFPVGYNNK